MLSGSGVERAMKCPASASLPKQKRSTGASKKGTTIHNYVADYFTLGEEEALKKTHPNSRKMLRRISMDILKRRISESSSFELPIIYNALRGNAKSVVCGMARDYGDLSDGDIPMTLDIVYGDGDRLIELKTGKIKVPIPQENWQIKTQALGLARLNDKKEIHASLYTLVNDRWEPEYYMFTEFDLDCISDDLSVLYEKVKKQPPITIPSESNCLWCDCKPHCPEWKVLQ